ncbi:hypothetical protein [Nocardia nova]|uniref:hypothetical protein n=1 Tax=Nocardia nova TaxID=37330 RepID=UPI001893E574|nr:hypothetical protein [Nocardia nova]MBF6277011.1 hypothetical protein [Nocardia nova]
MPDLTPEPLTNKHLETFVFDPHRAAEQEVAAMASELLAARARLAKLEEQARVHRREYRELHINCEKRVEERNDAYARITELKAELTQARDLVVKFIDSRARDIVAEETSQPFPDGYVTGFLNDQDRVTGLEHVSYPTRVQAVERAEYRRPSIPTVAVYALRKDGE